MITIENLEVVGLKPTIRGMRNPMNSWAKSDTTDYDNFLIGDQDHDLMMWLAKAGTDHAKYRRMLVVYMDIVAPLYWYKEFDTYKVGTVANSCSTMHKIHSKPIELSDFSIEEIDINGTKSTELFGDMVKLCELLRQKYLETKDPQYWRALIQFLPESYNQRRTVMLNYEVLANIYKSRKNHKLQEWRDFCETMKEQLPDSELFTMEGY